MNRHPVMWRVAAAMILGSVLGLLLMAVIPW